MNVKVDMYIENIFRIVTINNKSSGSNPSPIESMFLSRSKELVLLVVCFG